MQASVSLQVFRARTSTLRELLDLQFFIMIFLTTGSGLAIKATQPQQVLHKDDRLSPIQTLTLWLFNVISMGGRQA